MSPMLEKAAKAIFDAAPFREAEGPWESQSEEYRCLCGVYARAALLAIREPDEGIRGAMDDLGSALITDLHERDQYLWFALKSYRASILAILGEAS